MPSIAIWLFMIYHFKLCRTNASAILSSLQEIANKLDSGDALLKKFYGIEALRRHVKQAVNGVMKGMEKELDWTAMAAHEEAETAMDTDAHGSYTSSERRGQVTLKILQPNQKKVRSGAMR